METKKPENQTILIHLSSQKRNGDIFLLINRRERQMCMNSLVSEMPDA